MRTTLASSGTAPRRGLSPAGLAGVLVVMLGIWHAAPADAGGNDLVLSRLGTIVGDDVVGHNHEFRALASELGVVFAPRLMEPADTLGFGGFQFTADVAYTSISNTATYWRVLESSSDPSAVDASHGQSTLSTVGLFVRKGIWMPLPSFEMGLGAIHLGDSQMWAGQAYAKFALHEGYHELPLPSVAIRGAGSRVMGSPELDLTVASIDLSASKDFGVGGVVRLTPYGGWNWLIIVPRSDVIDKTPHIDLRSDPLDANMNFVFVDQDNIHRNRFFLGVKAKYYVFTLHAEAVFALAGGSVDDRSGTDLNCSDAMMPTHQCDASDTSSTQSTFTLGAGLDF